MKLNSVEIRLFGIVGGIFQKKDAPPSPTVKPDISQAASTDTNAWPTYYDAANGYSFQYPPFLAEQQGLRENQVMLYYCDGAVQHFTEGSRCAGKDYRIAAVVINKKLNFDTVVQAYDAAPILDNGETGIRSITSGKRIFYIGKHNVYAYNGWKVHTRLGNDFTLEFDFSGSEYVKDPSSNILTKDEFEEMNLVLARLKTGTNAAPKADNLADCEAIGGRWDKGLAPKRSCNVPTSDGGKSCNDSAQCESDCVAAETAVAGEEAQGECYQWQDAIGTCLAYLEKGVVQPVLCID
jgi:hypothetical protein